MKKVIVVEDLCCERCAKRLATGLELTKGILKAKANYKKNAVYLEVSSGISDEELKFLVEKAGYAVVSVADRKGIFS